MAVSASRPVGLPGIQLLRGRPDAVSRWAARGVVPLRVVPLDGWTAVLPAGQSRAAAPYDECLPILAARRVPARLRAALGFFVIDGKSVLTVHRRGWRASTRFAVWEPATGVLRSPDLQLARPQDLVRAAGHRRPRAGRELHDLLRSPGADARGMLTTAMSLLGLPGAALLAGGASPEQLPGAVLVEPRPRQVARFDSAAQVEVTLRAELGLDR